MERIDNFNIVLLCNNIERYIGRLIKTPKDFVFLRETIFEKTHLYVSETTLKRIWGYINETNNVRLSTLDLLAQFVGYQDWSDFCHNYSEFKPGTQEGEVQAKKLNYTELEKGQVIEVTWLPDASCCLEYQGNNIFKVTASTNTRLKKDDTVNCFYIIKGKSFYFMDSIIDGKKYDLYYVGKTGGVDFKILK